MKYEIRLSAPRGEIVPLVAVASAKAHFRATAGGTDFHKPAYDGSFTRFADDLLREANCGRLKVCDQWGIPGESDALIADAKRSGDLVEVSRYVKEPDWERLRRENKPIAAGVWNFTHLDLGPREVDWTGTHLSALCTTLKWLNEWGASRGDEFTATHEGVEWADERGIHCPSRAAASSESGQEPQAPESDATQPVPTAADEAPPLKHWKMRVQAEAAAEWKRLRALHCNPTRRSIRPHLLEWCKANNVKTDGNINPSDGYLRTHVLSGKHWTPPAE